MLHNVRAEQPPSGYTVYAVVCSSSGCLHPLLLHKMNSEGKAPQPVPPRFANVNPCCCMS